MCLKGQRYHFSVFRVFDWFMGLLMRAKKVLKMNWLVKSLAPGYYEVLWLCAILCIEDFYGTFYSCPGATLNRV